MANEINIVVSSTDKTAAGFTSAAANQRKLADATKATGQEYERTSQKASGFGASLKRIGEVAAGVLLADVLQSAARKAQVFMHQTVEAASALGESINAVNKVFGSASEKVQAWGRDNANAIGLSTRAFNQAATPLGSMLKNQGLSLDQVTDHTVKLTQRAADMASVFNTDVMDALTAIQAGLRGEQDPLERYGVSLSAVSVEARALADSHKTSTAQLTAQEKALARLNLIYDQTADTAGDFRDTADGLANAQRIATATMEDAKAKIGVAFIPIMAEAAKVTGMFAGALTALPQPAVLTAAAIAGVGAAILLLAPRAMATKEALDKMAASDSALQRGMGRTAVFATKAAGALIGISLAAMAVNAVLGGKGVNVQVDALAESMASVAKSGLNAGEGVRVFGGDLGKLKYDLGTLGSGFWAEFGNGVASVAEVFGDFGRDDSLTKAKERIAGIDAALASLVQAGRGAEAADAFKFLSDQAKDAGISVDDLRAGLPQYTGALQVAATGTTKLGTAAFGAARDVKALDEQLDNTINKAFSYEEAQDDAANAVARLAEQVKQQKAKHEAGAASLTANTQAARDNRDAVRDIVRKYEELMVQADEAGESTAGFQRALEDQLVAMGFARDEAHRYVQKLQDVKSALDAIPKTVTITVKTSAELALQQMHETDREMRALARNPIYYNVKMPSNMAGPPGGGFDRRHGGITGAASGGARGGWTMTGEAGPELVRLPYGSTVIPAGTTRNMLSGSGGGGTVTVLLDLIGDDEDLMRRLRKKIRIVGGTGSDSVQVALGRNA